MKHHESWQNGGSRKKSNATPVSAFGLSCYLSCCFVGLSPLVVVSFQAQTLTTLHSFSGTLDGARPESILFLQGDTLYRSTRYGGAGGDGTVFKIHTDGTGFKSLYSFTSLDAGTSANPYGLLAVSNGSLYRGGIGDYFSVRCSRLILSVQK